MISSTKEDLNNVSKDEFGSSVMFALKSEKEELKLFEILTSIWFLALQLQTKKIIKYQELSYEWHLQVSNFFL